jgi:hypothetical protein
MATAPTGTTTTGHGGFNDQENNPDPSSNPNHPLPTPGPQPTNTPPLTGTGVPTGTRPPGWMKIFLMLLGNYQKAYFAYCMAAGIPPAPLPDSIIAMLETQTDRLCARYNKELSAATI